MAPAAESPARRGHGVGGAADKAVPRKQHRCCRALQRRAQLQPQRSSWPRSAAEYWEAAPVPPGEGQLEPCSSPVSHVRADPRSVQGEVSLGQDPTSLPSSRSEAPSASLPGLCSHPACAQPGLERSPRWPSRAPRGSGSTASWASSLRVTQGPELGGHLLLWGTGRRLASPSQLQLALEPGGQ